MMSENLAGAAVEVVTKAPEMAVKAADLAKMLLEMLEKLGKFGGGAVSLTAKGISGITAQGKIKNAAKDSGALVMQQAGISSEHAKILKDICKEQGIPVAFKKSLGAENVTAIYSGNYKDAFVNAMSETVRQSLAEKPLDYTAFKIKESEIAGIKSMCEKHGIDVNFAKTSDGNILCSHQIKDRSAVEIVKKDYQKIVAGVAQNFKCGYVEGDISDRLGDRNKFVFTDKELGKTVTLNNFHSHSKVSQMLQDKLGFDPVKANLAADKFGATLNEFQRQSYNYDTKQIDIIKNLDREIKIPNESLLVKDYNFTRLNYKSDGINRIVIAKDNNPAMLMPAKMTRAEMEKEIQNKLGVIDVEVVKQICGKAETVNKNLSDTKTVTAERGDFSVEKISAKEFSVKQNGTAHQFSFSDKNKTVAEIQSKFGASKEKAAEIFDKAKKQSVLVNNVKKAQEQNKSQSAPVKDKPAKTKSKPKGSRKF
jgi:hypothetical protein